MSLPSFGWSAASVPRVAVAVNAETLAEVWTRDFSSYDPTPYTPLQYGFDGFASAFDWVATQPIHHRGKMLFLAWIFADYPAYLFEVDAATGVIVEARDMETADWYPTYQAGLMAHGDRVFWLETPAYWTVPPSHSRLRKLEP